MDKVIYPGTFDPITNGHLDVLCRASKLAGEVVLGVAAETGKNTLFTLLERQAMAAEAVADEGLRNVHVTVFEGLLVDFAIRENAAAIVRGLRAVSDFEFEFQMALMNRNLNDKIETIFLMPRDTYAYLSSSIIKGISRAGGPVEKFVPPHVADALAKRLAQSQTSFSENA